MEPFRTHRGQLALLDWSDVNTDLIIPARYLKRIERTGFGPLLFADKRYAPGAAPEPDAPEKAGPLAADFPLNSPTFRDATLLVVGRNFGCGSSREHAVWAVQQAGFRAVIAPGPGEGFADIFESNAYNNGLLPIELPDADWQTIAQATRENPGRAFATIDLETLTITVETQGESTPRAKIAFAIPEAQRTRLLKGLDAIAETLAHETEIARHEQTRPAWMTPTAPH